MEPKADRPRSPRLENSDKSDLPGMEDEGQMILHCPLTRKDTARAQSTDKWAWPSAFAQWLFKLGFSRKPTDEAEYNSQFGWSVSTSLV